jgi:hypothetical protein
VLIPAIWNSRPRPASFYIAEVFSLGIAADILEGQDRDGFDGLGVQEFHSGIIAA